MIIAGYFVLYVVCWLCIFYELKGAPTDVELWGEEIE
jgi:hypothetical protein